MCEKNLPTDMKKYKYMESTKQLKATESFGGLEAPLETPIKESQYLLEKLKKYSGVYLCEIEELLQEPSHFSPFKANYYVIYLYESGQGMYSVATEELLVNEKQILLVPSQKVHQFYHTSNYKGKALLFTESFFTNNGIKNCFLFQNSIFNTNNGIVYLSLKQRERNIKELFAAVSEELTQPITSNRLLIISNYIVNILLMINELGQEKPKSTKKNNSLKLLNDFKQLVLNEKNKNKPIKYYTNKLNVSGLSLEQAFKKHEQITPKQWLIQILILEIKQELRYTRLTISEIAFRYGFSDVSNFTKFYKKNTGVTPTEFRNKLTTLLI